MSHAATSWAANLEGLPVGAKLILMLLAECHNGKSGRCDPSMDWLCKKTGFKQRMLLRHIAVLEEGNLVTRETESLGRAKGKKTSFSLRIGAVPNELQVYSDTRVPEYTCNIGSLDVYHSTPAYKEEPEENRNTKVESPDFDEAWKIWNSCKLKVGQSKKPAKAQWPKAVRKAGGSEPIMKAIQAIVSQKNAFDGNGFESNLPDMWRWLRDERWRDVEVSEGASSEMDLDSWREAMRRFVDHQIWPEFLGPKPGEADCRVPDGLLNYWRKTQETAA
jgi:hypothetical protein